ncbi:hypothetical protein Dimus_035714 [Dionaea muscipula]
MTTHMQNQDATINNLMTQIGQLANQNSNRPPEALPSNTETNPSDVKAITLRSGASYLEPKGKLILANSESSNSRSPRKRKMKRSTSGKGVDVEPASKKNSAPGTTKEIDTPDTEVSRPDLASTSGKRNLAPPKEKDKITRENASAVFLALWQDRFKAEACSGEAAQEEDIDSAASWK